MNCRKEYYGNTFLAEEEVPYLGEVKLEYYKIEEDNNFGIEVVKSEKRDEIETSEKIKLDKITSNENVINNLLNKLCKNKVTPVELTDVVNDLMYNFC